MNFSKWEASLKERECFAWIALTTWLILYDQISDHVTRIILPLVKTVQIASLFNTVLLFNPSTKFTLIADAEGGQRYLLILIAVIASALFSRSFFAESRWHHKTAYVLLIGGAGSNVIDRILNGVVTDLFAFYMPSVFSLSFNFADCWIALGCLLAFFNLVRRMPASDPLGMF